MSNYKRVSTSAEVWAVIRAAHPELIVFGTYSAPDGDFYGDHSIAKMFTSYGFNGSESPIVEAETTWDVSPEGSYERKNEQHKYWLCMPFDGE